MEPGGSCRTRYVDGQYQHLGSPQRLHVLPGFGHRRQPLTVVRRVERGMVAVGLVQDHPNVLEAVNRLSDLLFVVARNADGKSTLSKE
ncbi:MAG TPA: ATP:cob(I)alamin adenosyltransferase [Rubrobacteraceae bacterium]|nr:ATP:cob(I)alamin adenosyltransferase [Rubrobacteraceae bacterium]